MPVARPARCIAAHRCRAVVFHAPYFQAAGTAGRAKGHDLAAGRFPNTEAASGITAAVAPRIEQEGHVHREGRAGIRLDATAEVLAARGRTRLKEDGPFVV